MQRDGQNNDNGDQNKNAERDIGKQPPFPGPARHYGVVPVVLPVEEPPPPPTEEPPELQPLELQLPLQALRNADRTAMAMKTRMRLHLKDSAL